MLRKLFLPICIVFALVLESCDKEEEAFFDYHAHIHQPTVADKHVGDTLQLKVHFESMTGETIHNIKVEIWDIEDPDTHIFHTHQHVHATDGTYMHEEELILSNLNGFDAHKNYLLTASVWGESDNEELETATVQFHVHP